MRSDAGRSGAEGSRKTGEKPPKHGEKLANCCHFQRGWVEVVASRARICLFAFHCYPESTFPNGPFGAELWSLSFSPVLLHLQPSYHAYTKMAVACETLKCFLES